MERVYYQLIKHHLENWRQIVFIEGPRQAGKTTLAKRILQDYKTSYYLNYDNMNDREIISSGQNFIEKLGAFDTLSDRKPIIVLDEIHKLNDWKNYLKGFYDTYGDKIQIIATGSAKLTLYKKSQDSLMGRYLPYTLYPLSTGEIIGQKNSEGKLIKHPSEISNESFYQLYNYGGFPDPYFKADKRFHLRWNSLRLEQLFRDDILRIEDVRNISGLELLAHILTNQTSEQVNYSSLAKKIQVTDQTVRKWINLLEEFYFGFTILPWHENIVRSVIKAPKFYLNDWSSIQNSGSRAENFIACHLKKATGFWNDSGEGEFGLFYLRTKDQKKVDFLVTKDKKPWFLVEVKQGNNAGLNKNLQYFQESTKAEHAFQVVIDMDYVNSDCFAHYKPIIVPARTFLSQLV